MPRSSKTSSLLSLFKARKSSRATNTASMKNASENQEDKDTGKSFSWSLCREEVPSSEMCSSDNNSCGAAEETASSKDCNTEDEAASLDGTILQFQEFRETQIQLEKCLQILRTNYHRDHTMIMQALEEENLRQAVLTKELADLNELHQNETVNFKEELGSTKEMIRNWINEATTEFHEALEALQCRVLKLEKQQPQPQMGIKKPQYTVVGKMLNFVSTLGHFAMSLKPSGAMLFLLLSGGLLTLMLKYQDCLLEYFDLLCNLSSPRCEK